MVIRKATPRGKYFLKKNYVSTESVTNTLSGYMFNLKYGMETIKMFIQHPEHQPIRNRFLSFPGSIG